MISESSVDLAEDLRPGLERELERMLGSGPCQLVSLSKASNGFSAQTIFASALADGKVRELVIRLEEPDGEIFLDTQLLRQATVMQLLSKHDIPVPRVLGVVTDSALVGRQFLVMERCAGRTFPQNPNYNHSGWVKELSPAGRATIWETTLTLLGSVNRLTAEEDFSCAHRPRFGVPGLSQYLGWLSAWRNAALGARPHRVIDAAMEYLNSTQPKTDAVDFVWGDSNPCNVLYRDDLSISALLDFEAAALGPGELDLGWWFFLDRTRRGQNQPLSGIPSRAECIEIYSTALRRAARAVDYFEIVAGVRMALVIVCTVDRLIRLGRIHPESDAGLRNPMVNTLAGLLGIPGEGVGPAFKDFVFAVTQHGHQ